MMRRGLSNTQILVALAAGLGYSVTGEMAESHYDMPKSKPDDTEKKAAAMAKAEAKRERKAAKRLAA